MLRLALGLALVGLVAATQAAETDDGFFAPKLDLSTIKFVHSGTDFIPLYQLGANVALARPSDFTPIGLRLGSTFQLLSRENIRVTGAAWQQVYDGDRVSLPHLLSVKLKGEQANITFKPRSVSIEGERLKITFRPQSALIESDRLKILLQPHSATMMWGKAF